MQGNKLDGMRVAMIVADNFEQVEMTSPRQALEQAGAKVTLISPTPGQVTGRSHDVDKVDSFKVDMSLDDANPMDFDAVMFPGGSVNADNLRMNPKAQNFAKQFDSAGKPIASICHAPWLLVSSDLVKGRTLTSWPSLQVDIRNAGGNWVDQQMVRDRNWVTSRSPQDLEAFNPAMVSLFAESKVKR
ncbi:MAG: type 1 glutamine amidotransferase domain-containing protein [Ktedonobacteraceae bacterium]